MRELSSLSEVVATVTGPRRAWFKDKAPEHLLASVYPVPGGALVVERTPPSVEGPPPPGVPPSERGKFRVFHVSAEGGRTRLLSGWFHSRRGAQTWARGEQKKWIAAPRRGQKKET